VSLTPRMRIAPLYIVFGLVLVACSEAPAPEPDPRVTDLTSSATREDTIVWLEERTYGQAVTTVYQDTLPACGSCEVRLVPVGSFGRVDDQVLLVDTPVRVERDSRGRFYAVAVGWTLEVIVYEPDGSIVRTVGRQGEGPGEFQHTVTDLLIGPGDSLFVAHDGMRLSVFDSAGMAADTRLLDTGGAGSRAHLLEASEDEVLLAYAPPRSADEHQLHPLHAFDRAGAFLRSFGPVDLEALQLARSLPDRPIQAGFRGASMAPDGAIWVWSSLNYRIERVERDSAVDHVMGIVGPDGWNGQLTMTSLDETGMISMERPGVSGFHQIDPNLGVAVLSVASPGWEDVELRRHPRYPAELYAPDVYQRLRDSVIDIIHIPTGEVLARKRIAELAHLMSDGTLYTVFVDDLGVISVEAFKVELAGWDG
jgi:hypothetical protein